MSGGLPSKIKGTFDLPKIHELILATSEKNVQGFIEFELIKLAERINVSGNLTDGQVEFIASQLVKMYPTETLADFKICFESVAMGKYIKQDKVFKLDGTEIGYAMAQYLDEKYLVSEEELMKEKDNQYANIKSPEPPRVIFMRVNDYPWVNAPVKNKQARTLLFQQQFYAMSRMKGRFVPKISDKEIRQEGQVKPKFKPYPSSDESHQKEINAKIRKGREIMFLERHPGATEEQVKEYLDSFKDEH